MSMRGLSFPKSARLRSRQQFLALRNCSRRQRSAFFLVVWKPNGLGQSRLGVTASRRVANAVGRNRVKRLVREAFRTMAPMRPPGMDINVIALPGAADSTLDHACGALAAAYSAMTATAGRGCPPGA